MRLIVKEAGHIVYISGYFLGNVNVSLYNPREVSLSLTITIVIKHIA